MKVHLLYGTESGNAEYVAADLAERLSSEHAVEVFDLIEIEPEELKPDTFHIVICSTYGDGELPYGAQPFYDRLGATQCELHGVRFGLFGLGDTAYPDTFVGGAHLLADKLTELGAHRIGEVGVHDASGEGDASEAAIAWCAHIQELIVERVSVDA